jgi:hypothetical protein
VEYLLGLIPTSGSSRFGITGTDIGATGLILTWPSAEGFSFEIQTCTDLCDWTTAETIVGKAGQATASWTDSQVDGDRKYYRVRFSP